MRPFIPILFYLFRLGSQRKYAITSGIITGGRSRRSGAILFLSTSVDSSHGRAKDVVIISIADITRTMLFVGPRAYFSTLQTSETVVVVQAVLERFHGTVYSRQSIGGLQPGQLVAPFGTSWAL